MTLDCLGMGTIIAALKQAGTHDVASHMLHMPEKTSLSTRPSTPSGPGAFLMLILRKTHLTSCVLRTGEESVGSRGGRTGSVFSLSKTQKSLDPDTFKYPDQDVTQVLLSMEGNYGRTGSL